jgi:hypothetical protein
MPAVLVKKTVQKSLDALAEQQVHFVPPYVTMEEGRIRCAPYSVTCAVQYKLSILI